MPVASPVRRQSPATVAGAGSSQRHWHSGEDEFVYVVSGEITLVTNAGEEILRAGDCAAFSEGRG